MSRVTRSDPQLIDEHYRLTLSELSELCGVDDALIGELVRHGVLHPLGHGPAWQFTATALVRTRRALRLQRDLDVDLPGLALSLDLLDELDGLRREVQILREQIHRLIEPG